MVWHYRMPTEESEAYTPKAVSDQAMRDTEAIIWNSPDCDNNIRPYIIWMLRKSENLTKRIAMSMYNVLNGESLASKFWHSVHDMDSSLGDTQLNRFIREQGTEMVFSQHGGIYLDVHQGKELEPEYHFISDEIGRSNGSTVWISHYMYDHDAEVIAHPTTDEALDIAFENRDYVRSLLKHEKDHA